MRVIGKIVRTVVLTALALVAILNSQTPQNQNEIPSFPTTAAVVDFSYE
jgi:hypothetical protein